MAAFVAGRSFFSDEELGAALDFIGPDVETLRRNTRSLLTRDALFASIDLTNAGPLVAAVAREYSSCSATMAERHWHDHVEAYLLGAARSSGGWELSAEHRAQLQGVFDTYRTQRAAFEAIIFKGENRSRYLNPGTGLSVTDPMYRGSAAHDRYPNEGWSTLRTSGLCKKLSDEQQTQVNAVVSSFGLGWTHKHSIDMVNLEFPLEFICKDIYLENCYRSGIWGPRPRTGFIIEQLVVLVGKIIPLVSSTLLAVLAICRHIDGIGATVSMGIPTAPSQPPALGASLAFMHQFLADHPEIEANSMTTEQVVSSIVIPTTSARNSALVETLLDSAPQYVSDMRPGFRKPACVWLSVGRVITYETGYFAFASHAWQLPFAVLVNSLTQAAKTHYLEARKDANGVEMTWKAVQEQQMLEHSYFWVDVFCKNQHVAAPSMNEFHAAIDATQRVVAVLYPERPIVLSRIWCIFEIWTTVHRNVELVPTMSHEIFERFTSHAQELFDRRPDLKKPRQYSSESIPVERIAETESVRALFYNHLRSTLPVDVERAQATYPEDVRTILGMVEASVGVTALNKIVFDAVFDHVWKKIVERFGYYKFSSHQSTACFTGEGQVLLGDGVSTKRVQDLKVGDKVCTGEGDYKESGGGEGKGMAVAEVMLVCRYPIDAEAGVELCELGNLRITPEHPVYCGASGRWVMPKEVAGVAVRRVHNVDCVYNVELSRGASSMVIGGVRVMTLGQEVGFEPRSDALYGWGWRQNPERERFVRAMQSGEG